MTGKTQARQQAAGCPPVRGGLLARRCACEQHTIAGTECPECAKRAGDVPAVIEEVLSSPGEPLDPAARAFLEPRFAGSFVRVPVRALSIGRADDPLESAADLAAERALAGGDTTGPADLAEVMTHRGPRAAEAARSIGARAFTVGNHIVFGSGEYQPQSHAGLRLLAHELAHVAQQTGPTIRRKVAADDPALKPAPAGTAANARQPADQDVDKAKADPDKPAADANDKVPEPAKSSTAAEKKEDAKADVRRNTAKAGDKDKPAEAAKEHDKAADAAAKQDDPQSISDLSTENLALVDVELAEHQRWGAAAAKVGAAESGERAELLAKTAASESAFFASGAQGAAMAAGIKIAEKVIGKVVLKLAVQRLGAQAVKFTPVPGVGAMIGGAMAAYELANRDWKATGETIGKFGKGASIYDELANDIEAISTVIDVATQVLNVIAGIIGAISFGMWAVSIATLGIASPMAFTLSAIAGVIGITSLVLDGINALVLKELVTVFRTLDAFTSDADPREVIAQGDAIAKSAGAASGFVGGFAGGALVEHGGKLLGGRKKPPTPVPNHETPPAGKGEGPLVKAEAPAEGTQPRAGDPTDTKAPAADAVAAPAVDTNAPAPDVPAKAQADTSAKPPESTGNKAAVPADTPLDTASKSAADSIGGGKPPGGPPPGGGGEPPGAGEPPSKKMQGPVDERSFAELNDVIKDMDEGAFGDRLQSEAQRAQQPPQTAPPGTRYGRSAYRLLARLLRTEEARPLGTQAQHPTKWLASTRDIPNPLNRMTPEQISQNRMWLQTDPNRPATLLLTDPRGAGTRYFIGDQPAPRPSPQVDLFPSRRRGVDPRFTTEHRFMDNYMIDEAAARIRAQNPGGVDPNLVNLWAGAKGRWQMQGIPGQGDWGWQPQASAGAGTQLPLPGFPPNVTRAVPTPQRGAPGQLSFNFDQPSAANPNQLNLFGQAKTLQPVPPPQPDAPLQPLAPPQPDTTAPQKVRVATDEVPLISNPAEQQKLRVPTEEQLREEARNKQAELEQQQDEDALQDMEAEKKERLQRLLSQRLGMPSSPPHDVSKKDEPESQLRKNVREFSSIRLASLSPAEAAMYFVAGPAGVVTMRSAAKARSEPIVRHVNPHYPPPPCMPQDIVNIQNDILQALDARAQAEGIAAAMAAQKQHHKANEKPLDDMHKSTEAQIAATEAHKQAVARRAEANGKKQENEKKVEGKVAHYSEEAGKLATIKLPMRGFKRFTGLAYSLPDDPDILVSVKRNLIRMNRDTTKFLDQLDKMEATMNAQKAGEGDRQQGIQKDAGALRDTDKKADDSEGAFNKAKDTTEGLDQDNTARRDEATKMKDDANANAQGLQADAEQKKAKAASMAAALQAWAQNHRKARTGALNQTKENLEKQGYKVTEIKEL